MLDVLIHCLGAIGAALKLILWIAALARIFERYGVPMLFAIELFAAAMILTLDSAQAPILPLTDLRATLLASFDFTLRVQVDNRLR